MNTIPTHTEFWNEVFPKREPVVWRGAVSDLEIVQLARQGGAPLMDRLVASAGDSEVHVTGAPPRAQGRMGFSPDRWADWSRRSTTLRAFAADLAQELAEPSGHCMYMQSAPMASAFPALLPLTPVWLSDEQRMCAESKQLWIGSGGQRLAIHQDATHSVLCMVSGEKDLILFPPDEHPNLYTAPQQHLFKWPWRSIVDPRDPDLERYPRFADALTRARRIRIGPGDALFLPAYWWHSVDSFGLNVMFNSRWLDVPSERLNATTGAFAHVAATTRKLAPHRIRELRQRLDVAFGTGPVSEEADRALRGALRCAVAPPAADHSAELELLEPLVLSQESSAVMTAEGISLRNPRNGLSTTLAWSFAPMLSFFARPASPADALTEAQREFEVEPADFMTLVTRLRDTGTLVADHDPTAACDERLAATRIDAAVAHATLAVAGLPAHHRDAVWLSLRMYAFEDFGPQYEELPPERRGVLGRPHSPESTAQLERIAAASLRRQYGIGIIPPNAWTTHFRLDATRACGLSALGLCVGKHDSTRPAPLAWDHLELLAEFGAPNTPASVFDRASADWDMTATAFGELVETWIASGALVSCAAPRGRDPFASRTAHQTQARACPDVDDVGERRLG